MACQLQSADVPNYDIDMELGWNTDVFSVLTNNTQYTTDAKHGIQHIPSGLSEKVNFVGPVAPGYYSFNNTMDPTTLWPPSMDDPNTCSHPSQTQALHEMDEGSQMRESPFSVSSFDATLMPTYTQRRPSTSTPVDVSASAGSDSLNQSTPVSTVSDNAIASSPGESEKTRRARYAANQRHSKAQKARKDSHHADSNPDGVNDIVQKRKERHREKNKVAAAKCRARQRKQVQTIQEKGSHLAGKNVELKTMIQDLRGELNGLRSIALNHQQCNCHVTQYNESQAERVVAEYRSLCNGQHLGSFAEPHR